MRAFGTLSSLMTLLDSDLEKVKTCAGVAHIDNGLGAIPPKTLLNANKSKTTAPVKTIKTPRMSSKMVEHAAYVQSLFDSTFDELNRTVLFLYIYFLHFL